MNLGIAAGLTWIAIIGTMFALYFSNTTINMLPAFLLGFIAGIALFIHFISIDDGE